MKSNKNFPCATCGSSFESIESLRQHLTGILAHLFLRGLWLISTKNSFYILYPRRDFPSGVEGEKESSLSWIFKCVAAAVAVAGSLNV